MNLYTNCTSCLKSVTVSPKAKTRPNLHAKLGDEFMLECRKCGNREAKHVNDIIAEPSKHMLLFGVVLGLGVTAFLWWFYGAISTLSSIVLIIVWGQQTAAAKAFNRFTVRRKTRPAKQWISLEDFPDES